MSGKGKDRRPVLDEVHADMHWNLRVNPSSVEAQVQGSVILALGTVIPSHHITLRNGVVERCHFNGMSPPLRRDVPKMMAGRIDLGADAHKCMAKPVLPP